MINVTLYSKPGCHLCEEVKAELERLTAVYPHHLTEIDINNSRDLFARYHLTIPVVHIGQTELQAPITAAQLATALQATE
ncbi:MAG: glutaredoxin family protein [Anaerolineae bacterium]